MSENQPYRIRLSNFEGPYDLLLYLIRQNEIDIYDVEISRILEQYMEYLNELASNSLELDEIAEFFVVAATLMRIKAHSLLPSSDNVSPEEAYLDEIATRRRLIEHLLACQDYKFAARYLEKRQRDRVPVQKFTSWEYTHKRELDTSDLDLDKLLKSFQRYLFSMNVFDEMIAGAKYRIEDYTRKLLQLLRKRQEITFGEFAQGSRDRGELIIKFMALLELSRQGLLGCQQNENFSEIFLTLKSA